MAPRGGGSPDRPEVAHQVFLGEKPMRRGAALNIPLFVKMAFEKANSSFLWFHYLEIPTLSKRDLRKSSKDSRLARCVA